MESVSVIVGAACAQVKLNDSEIPGSVIIFPKFQTGTVAIDGVTTPRTEFELGVVCPVGSEHQPVRIRMQWVCPGSPQNPPICPTIDFDVLASVNGKAVFNTEGPAFPGNKFVPPPPCPNGYLIGWVIDITDRPVKFDGLFSDAVIRNTPTAIGSYAAIPIPVSTLDIVIDAASRVASTRTLPTLNVTFTGLLRKL